MLPQGDKKRLMKRLDSLKSEQIQWRFHWMDLAAQVKPRGARFFTSDRATAGSKKNSAIVNGTPTWALRTLAAGMMAGITSPSRPWFRLLITGWTQDEMTEAAKMWLGDVEEEIRFCFAKSNLYNCLHTLYSGVGLYGTAVMFIDDDDADTVRGYSLPIGQFFLASSARGEVDTLFRTFEMSVGQLVERFGREACSAQAQAAFDRGSLDEWHEVVHVVEPNPIVSKHRLDARSKPWLSWWFESTGSREGIDAKPLRLAGYEEKPFCAPRWDVSGESVYGDSPGMDALGDCRALQQAEKRKSQMVDKIVNPPLRGPSSLSNRRVSLLPGDVNYVDTAMPGQTLAPVYEINSNAPAVIEATIREHETRIKTAYYADLWLMLSQADGEMTAREVVERREEKLLQLGTVLERLQNELLNPLVDRVFGILQRRGKLPKAPPELSGKPLRVEYISIMAQAQKLLGTTGIERLAGFIGQVAAVKPEILDKFDVDATVDEYSEMLGVPAGIVRTDEEVATIRAQRQQMAQQQQQAAQMQQAAETAKTASQADTEGNNALTTMLQAMGAK
jgi:hypothetical protein